MDETRGRIMEQIRRERQKLTTLEEPQKSIASQRLTELWHELDLWYKAQGR